MQQAELVLRQAETFRQSGRHDEAIACLRTLLKTRPDLAAAHNNLGLAWAGKQDYGKAVQCFREALRIRRDFAEAYCNLGTSLIIQGDARGGEAAIEEALRIRPDFALAHVNRAAVWLRRGDFERGLPEFEWRRLGAANLPAQVQAPLWDGAASGDNSILLIAEHGIGDTLQFVRYAPLVRRHCGKVVLYCRKNLIPLLRQCPGIDRCASPDEALPRCDFQAPLMSLPLLLGTTLLTVPADVPYVHARRDLADTWRERFSRYSGFKIGIGWQGNPRYPTDDLRSIPVRHFRPLARVPRVALFSLQKGAGADQLAGLGPDFPVVEFGGEFDASTGAFMDTAAVMYSLDLVITSDTAVAHLAGAMGIPVWVALCKSADWRWLEERDDSPWYPTMRLFRQAELGDWGALFERMATELKLVLDGEKSRLARS